MSSRLLERVQRVELEVRDADGAEGSAETKVRGLAVPYNTETQLAPGLREQFKPGSFGSTIGDVRLLVGHQREGLPLARTGSGTMEVWESERGVEFEATLDASTPHGQNALSSIKRGDLDGVSIGFAARGDYDRTRGDDGDTLISWNRAGTLNEISMVAYPAYPTTEVQVRAADFFKESSKMSTTTTSSTTGANDLVLDPRVEAKPQQVRALVITDQDSAKDLFERSKQTDLPEDVRDTLFAAAMNAAQREADARVQERNSEQAAEDHEEFSKAPRIVRSSNDSASLILTTAAEPTDQEIRGRRALLDQCVKERHGLKDDFTNDEKALMGRKFPSDYAFERWARATTRRELEAAEEELHRATEHETRALGTTMKAGTDADGGHTLSYRLLPQLTLEMAATGPMADPMCCRRITVSDGRELRIPKVTSTDTVKAIIEGEGDDIANYKPVFAQTSLTPYKYAMSYPATSEMLQDTEVDITGFLVQNFGIAFGRAMNEHFTTGSGSSQPNGVFTGATAYGTKLSKTADLDKDDFVLVSNLIDPAYAHGSKFFVHLHNASIGLLRKTLESGHFIFNQDSGNMGFPGTILGIPVRVNQALDQGKAAAKKVMLVGNHQYYASVVVGSMPQIDFSEHFAFGSDQVVYRAKWRFDGDVEVPDAFRSFTTAA